MSNPADNFKNQITEYIDAALKRGWITKKEKDFLLLKYPLCPVFYGLPKVLKSTINPTLRPIVASIGSLTEPRSQLLTSLLRNLSQASLLPMGTLLIY